MADDTFKKLVQASASEDIASLEDANTAQSRGPILHQPLLVMVSWILLVIVLTLLFQYPAAQQAVIGEKGNETIVSVAIYQLAYRIEVYRNMNGSLPDFLEPEWLNAVDLTYQQIEGEYVIQGRAGDFEMSYRDGDNPETLMHKATIR